MSALRGNLAWAATAVLVVLLSALPAGAQNDRDSESAPLPRGSISAQLRLLNKLNAAMQGMALADAIGHNRELWDRLSPDERERFRDTAVAFLNEKPEQQQDIIRQFDQWIRTAAEQQEKYRRMNVWLQEVINSFTPEQRKELSEMTPEQRAKAILDRRDQLVQEGKLKLEDAPADPNRS